MRTKRIALYLGLNDFYDHGIAKGVVRYARRNPGWRLYGYGWMFRPLADLGAWEGDGVVGRIEGKREARALAGLGVPVVDVAGAYPQFGFAQVSNDDRLTGEQAGRHLASLGFDRYAFCGVSGVRWSEARKEGFLASVGRRSVPSFERPLAWWERIEDFSGLASWVASLEPPLAVFACNDSAGLKLTELCRKTGVAVPDALAILGVDNEDILCELSSPPLSSIMLDCERIGYEAASLLDELSSGAPSRSRLVSPRETIERESTRTFSCGDPAVAKAVVAIRAEAHRGLTVSELSKRVSASRRSLEGKFRRYLGRTVHEEIVRSRLSRAKLLLHSTTLPIRSIASESGFGSLQRFHETFKKTEGRSPNAFRKSSAASGP